MDVTVQNTGSETIDSFYLFSRGPLSSPYYSCSDEYLQGFRNMKLSPGDTITLHIKILRTWEAPPGYPYSLSVTLYTSSPNGKLDVNPSNDTDSYSKTVLGINNNLPENQTISIYPNPAYNVLHIDNNTGLNTNILVTDITGKEIISGTNPKNAYDLDISGLPSGVYFVKTLNEFGMQVEKMVKE